MWLTSAGFFSLNLAVSVAAAPVAVLLAFVLLYVITHPRFSRSPLHSKRPLTLTQANTLKNRHENGGTGVWSRKWRRKVAAALSMRGPVRRGLGDFEDDDFDDQDGDDSSSGSEYWKVKAKPIPVGLKGVLKREGSFELTKLASASGTDSEGEQSGRQRTLLSPIPSPATSTSSTASFYSPPLPSPSPSLSPPPLLELVPSEPLKAAPKSVSFQEPCLVELEDLRELWNSEEMQSSVNGGNGLGGIAGYRRTRDYFNGQGKKNKTPPPVVPKSASEPALKSVAGTATKEGPSLKQEKENDDEGSSRPRRPLNPSLTRSSTGSSSLSPSPVNRRPAVKRALSPNTNGIVVGSAASRRRGLSPNSSAIGTVVGGTNSIRSSSSSPAPSADRAQPRWIKQKKPSTVSRTANPTLRLPRSVNDDDDEEEEETGSSGRNGTMSATVSDDEDFEDVPPTPPSQPSLTLAMAPVVEMSGSKSTLSSSLELLLDPSLTRDRSGTDEVISHSPPSPAMSGSESLDNSPSPLPPLDSGPTSLFVCGTTHLPTPSPSPPPTSSSSKFDGTPSFSITPASPEVALAPLPSLSPISSPSSHASGSIATLPEQRQEEEVDSDNEDEDPNDPLLSPTVEAKGVTISSGAPTEGALKQSRASGDQKKRRKKEQV